MIFYCTKPHLSNSDSLHVVSVKYNINFNFQLLSTFVSLVSHNIVSLKVVHLFMIYQQIKFHCPTSTSVSFASTSDVWKFALCKGWSYENKKTWYQGHIKRHDLPTAFHNSLLVGSKIEGQPQKERQKGDLVKLTLLFNEQSNNIKMGLHEITRDGKRRLK
jgi:hypothetical protein